MNAAEAAAKITGTFGAQAELVPNIRDEVTVSIAAEALVDVMTLCKEELEFNYLIDICSVDNTGSDPRFEVVYELYSLDHHSHLRIKTTTSEDNPEVATVSHLWPTADWHEREIYDMMGIKFTDHPDLRRILMWEGFPYFPLRKEFPLAGKSSDVPEVAFSEPAPLAGGPFVSSPSGIGSEGKEPRAQ